MLPLAKTFVSIKSQELRLSKVCTFKMNNFHALKDIFDSTSLKV